MINSSQINEIFQKYLTNHKLLWLAIPLVGIVIYLNCLTGQFVLDDPYQVLENPAVHSLSNIPSLFLGSSFGGGQNLEGIYYKPFMTSSYTLLYSLFGPNPTPFHLLQLGLHIGNSLLIFWLFRRFFSQIWALMLTLLFLTHPINVEAVSYISALQDVLFFFFGMLALLVATMQQLTTRYQILLGILLFFSLLSKETGLLFAAIALLYRLLIIKKNVLSLLITFVITLTLYAILRYYAVGLPFSKEPIFPIERASLWERVSTLPKIIFYYLKTAFFPKDLAVAQHWVIKTINLKDFFIPLVVDASFLAVLIYYGKRLKSLDSRYFKVYIFLLSWFLLGLLAHLHFIPLDATVSDHWFYFPLVGLLGMLGNVLAQIKNLQLKKYLLFSLIILVMVFSVRTILRNSDWKDGLTLAKHDITINTDSFALENNLAYELLNAHDYNQAEVHELRSTELAPYWWLNWNNLGIIYRHKIGQPPNQDYLKKSEGSLRKATDNTKTFYLPYENLAEVLFYFKGADQTKQLIEQTQLRLNLNDKLWFWYALSEYSLGDVNKAQYSAYQATKLNPTNKEYEQTYQAMLSGQKIIIQKPEY